MARIPDSLALNRKTVHIAPDIARYDASDAGTGLMALGKSVDKFAEAESNHQVAKAEADFLTLKYEQDRAYDQDDDYATIQDRYSEAMNEGLGSIASGIGNPRARSAFVENYRRHVAAGEENMGRLAWQKEADHEVAALQERTDGLIESALSSDDPNALGDTNATAVASFQAAHDMGYIDERTRVEMTKEFKQNLAIRKLATMDPRDRLQAAQLPWFKNLPKDKQATILREARAEQRKWHAQSVVDSIPQDASLVAGEALIKEKIQHPDARKDAMREWNAQVSRRRTSRLETSQNLVNQYYPDIRDGKKSTKDIPFADQKAIGMAGMESLRALEVARAKGTEVQFNNEMDLLFRKYRKNKVVLKNLVEKAAPVISPGQRKYWFPIIDEADEAQPVPYSWDTVVRKAAEAANVSEEDIPLIEAEALTWLADRRSEDERSRYPTELEFRNYVNGDLFHSVGKPGWIGDRKVGKNIAPELHRELIAESLEDDPETIERVQQVYRFVRKDAPLNEISATLSRVTKGDSDALYRLIIENDELGKEMLNLHLEQGTVINDVFKESFVNDYLLLKERREQAGSIMQQELSKPIDAELSFGTGEGLELADNTDDAEKNDPELYQQAENEFRRQRALAPFVDIKEIPGGEERVMAIYRRLFEERRNATR